MIARVEQNHGEHINFYEGPHIGVHKRKAIVAAGPVSTVTEGLTLIIEGPKTSLTIELDRDNMTKVFIMNDNGKTIDTHYL